MFQKHNTDKAAMNKKYPDFFHFGVYSHHNLSSQISSGNRKLNCHKLIEKRIQIKSLILFKLIYPHNKFLLPKYGFTGMSSSSR